MILSLGSPQFMPFEFGGGADIAITVPVTCSGEACEAVINLYIYEGSWGVSHGSVLATYSQDVPFQEGEQKEITFVHICLPTSQGRRDVGLEIVVEGEIVFSGEWDDVYHVATTTGNMIGDIMALGMMGMMAMMMSPMMEGGEL